MKTLIVEDEKAAVRNLTTLLAEVAPEVEVIDTLDSISVVIDWFNSHPMPQLVFMDIHLADGSAFEIFDYVEISCPIIFTTAYDEYALKAFKVNSIDYLLKPIGEAEVCAALKKLKHLNAASLGEEFQALIHSLKREESYRTHFLIPVKGDKFLPLPVEMVSYFYIQDGFVKAMTSSGREHIIPQTLDELTEVLNPAHFFRVNRQYLLSREAVKDIDLWFNNRLAINLRMPFEDGKVLVSKAKVSEFKDWFSGQL